MECVISACKWRVKTIGWKTRDQTLQHCEQSTTWQREGGVFRQMFSDIPTPSQPHHLHRPPPILLMLRKLQRLKTRRRKRDLCCFPLSLLSGRQPWETRQKCTVGGAAASRQPLARSYLMTPGPSVVQPKAMAVTNQRHAAVPTRSVMGLLLHSMCLLQFFFPSERPFHLTCPQFSNYRCHDIKATTSWSVKNPCVRTGVCILLAILASALLCQSIYELWLSCSK